MASNSDGSDNVTAASEHVRTMDAKKYVPVVMKEEVQWLTDMALGRGADSTEYDLWEDKLSSVQVRPVSASLDHRRRKIDFTGGAPTWYFIVLWRTSRYSTTI